MNNSRMPELTDPDPVTTTTTSVSDMVDAPQTVRTKVAEITTAVDLPRHRPATPGADHLLPTGPTQSKPAPPSSKRAAPPDPRTVQRNRFIRLSKIKCYLKEFPDEIRDCIPKNYQSLDDKTLEAIADECEWVLSAGNEAEIVAAGTVLAAKGFEKASPYMPPPYCFAHGVGERVQQELVLPDGKLRVDTMLGRAVTRLGIIYMGTLPGNSPWLGLFFGLMGAINKQCEYNMDLISQGQYNGPLPDSTSDATVPELVADDGL
jgi:hypothetical protein